MSTFARTPSGDQQVPRVIITDFATCIKQTIIDGLALWEGEWFLDANQGFPWLQKILGIKTPQPVKLGLLIQNFLLGIAGIVAVTASATFSGAKRAFSYQFVANLNNGQIITRTADGSFNISGNA